MESGIFRFFNFIFNFFQHFKKSQKTFKQPDIEKNEINEEKRDEQSAETDAPCQISYRRAVFMVAFYFYLNFVNFVDDFILMAILPIIIEDFHSTIIRFQLIFLGFLCSRMIISPFLTGAIPRYKQKMVLCIGLLFYSVLAFGCTYIPQQGFWLFLLVRLFVSSMAESCLGMVPVMIGDIFRPDQRTRMLGFYTCTNAFCCMLACIFGASAIDLASSNWRYALRITPAFGLFGLLLAIIIVKDPREGMEDEDDESDIPESKSNCCSDLKQLLTSILQVALNVIFL
ncbi:protein spinster homolog 1-like [Xenopus tropicalis]|uniref:Protein spinster homolog 1-like n=1 Tax=Xenopus tropicalis TaxID=8364 RepID=A0A8J1J8B3_XENTR|nr:protein spinster homolog 1-like [Xenopus tropicalis]